MTTPAASILADSVVDHLASASTCCQASWMRPFAHNDADVTALWERLRDLGLGSLSVEGITWTLNQASTLSLALYEGSHLSGGLCLIPVDLGDASLRVQLAAVSPEALRALAASAHRVLLRDRPGAEPAIVGIDLTEGYAESGGARFSFPTHGRVVVSAHGALLAVWQLGEGLHVVDSYLADITADRFLRPAIHEPILSAERIMLLLRSINVTGSGGIVVFVPNPSLHGMSSLTANISTPWPFARNAAHLTVPANALDRVAANDPGASEQVRKDRQRQLVAQEAERTRQLLEAFGRLTRADGAIVLHRDLNLAAIGQTLHGSAPSLVCVSDVFPPRPERTQSPAPMGGTRFQAAVGFASAHPNHVLFVVSSDGPIRMVTNSHPENEPSQVKVLQGVELFL